MMSPLRNVCAGSRPWGVTITSYFGCNILCWSNTLNRVSHHHHYSISDLKVSYNSSSQSCSVGSFITQETSQNRPWKASSQPEYISHLCLCDVYDCRGSDISRGSMWTCVCSLPVLHAGVLWMDCSRSSLSLPQTCHCFWHTLPTLYPKGSSCCLV